MNGVKDGTDSCSSCGSPLAVWHRGSGMITVCVEKQHLMLHVVEKIDVLSYSLAW